ncbi:hypothetical protein SAMN05444365_11918 [Micromonospora pattaloongensis]|uniref:Uncharacterized protein n=1 Tax=Micromonospora pattaloongensis TaxID=405436 RepID=A0A1H3T7H5_9ACTN|nr:hypothetical protein [Micromonospora pattaloongensis]SDZ46212.1 hypothetical protein SAMN05444365_11918 [Micromonospora pattaloongensis]
MNEEIYRQPLARAVLTTLARSRGGDDPLGSLARTVLSGEADLRTAVAFSSHGRALDDAFTTSLNERDALTQDERIEWERQAQQLRDAGAALTVEVETLGDATSEGREEWR